MRDIHQGPLRRSKKTGGLIQGSSGDLNQRFTGGNYEENKNLAILRFKTMCAQHLNLHCFQNFDNVDLKTVQRIFKLKWRYFYTTANISTHTAAIILGFAVPGVDAFFFW